MEQRVRINTGDQLQKRPVPIEHTLITATVIGSAQTIFTVRDGTVAEVKRLAVANTSGTAATLSLHSVPSGGSAATGNTELAAVSIPANTSSDLTEFIGGLYQAGTTLQAFAGTTSVLVIHGWITERL